MDPLGTNMYLLKRYRPSDSFCTFISESVETENVSRMYDFTAAHHPRWDVILSEGKHEDHVKYISVLLYVCTSVLQLTCFNKLFLHTNMLWGTLIYLSSLYT